MKKAWTAKTEGEILSAWIINPMAQTILGNANLGEETEIECEDKKYYVWHFLYGNQELTLIESAIAYGEHGGEKEKVLFLGGIINYPSRIAQYFETVKKYWLQFQTTKIAVDKIWKVGGEKK